MRRMSAVLLAAAAIGFGGLRAEAQTPSIWTDIMSKKKLTVCIVPSYQPGVHLTALEQCLPDFVTDALREALPVFGRQMAGYDHPDVMMTGVETRTSSPVRITRGKDFQSLNTRGLYPAGEGAGYAGGILSAAVDGIRAAEALVADLLAV